MRCDADKAPVAYHRRGNLPVGESAKAHAALASSLKIKSPWATQLSCQRRSIGLCGRGSTGSVLLKIVFDVATGTDDHDADINSEYGRKLGGLTAASWRSNRVKR